MVSVRQLRLITCLLGAGAAALVACSPVPAGVSAEGRADVAIAAIDGEPSAPPPAATVVAEAPPASTSTAGSTPTTAVPVPTTAAPLRGVEQMDLEASCLSVNDAEI